jgi:hypothetical protein
MMRPTSRLFSASIIVSIVACTFLVLITNVNVSDARYHDFGPRAAGAGGDTSKKYEAIEITKIEPEDEEHARRLLTCSDYQYKIKILEDSLYMYYVANGDTRSMSMKLEYFGEAWISLGTNRIGRGDMIGSEAWMALPEFPVTKSNPGVYEMTTLTVSGVTLTRNQFFKDGTIEQSGGVTTTSFTRPYRDFFLINQPINTTDLPNEFVWAYGFSNAYTAEIHERAGHFTLQVEECTAPFDAVTEIDKVKGRRKCGLFKLSIFCPFTLCGLLGRLLRLC